MKKLKLPIIGKFPDERKSLSMDEYVEFVNFSSTYFRKKKDAKKDLACMRANVPFSVK
jgi:hypothetical protein